ncbi:MAG: alginate export family protein [Bacteroidales bacterium]
MERFTIFTALLAISLASCAQLSLNADISPRAELRHGYRILPGPNDEAAAHINQRTRLDLGYDVENFRLHISFQDVRVWGQDPLLTNIPSLSVHEAWAEMIFKNNLTLKIGRQELKYDNQRFLSINDWQVYGRKHDLALLKYTTGATEIHFGTAFNQEWGAYTRNFGTDYGINSYKFMVYGWFLTDVSETIKFSMLNLADGYENPGNSEELNIRNTLSGYLDMDIDAIKLVFNPAFQFGKSRFGSGIRAFYFRLEGSMGVAENVRSTLGMELFSGNDYTATDGTNRAFDPLYGAGHANAGFMDYFTNIPANTAGAGLVNPYLKNRIRLNPRAAFNADLHFFFLQNNYVQNNETINKYLGTEIDFTLNYRFNEFTNIIGGFSTMFGSESMEIIKGGSKDEFAYFMYVMMRIRPRFL